MQNKRRITTFVASQHIRIPEGNRHVGVFATHHTTPERKTRHRQDAENFEKGCARPRFLLKNEYISLKQHNNHMPESEVELMRFHCTKSFHVPVINLLFSI